MMLDSATLSKALGKPVDDLLLTIAKYDLQGIAVADMAEVFAATEDEINEAMASPDYVDIKRFVAFEIAKNQADTDVSWDALENKSLNRLAKTLEMSNDPDFHLKVAAVANKAVRRNRRASGVLNPVGAGTRVQLTLTQRIVSKLTNGNEQIQERRIDLSQAEKLRIPIQTVRTFLEPPKQTFDDLIDAIGEIA